MKLLLKKQLKTYRLNYEQMQIVLQEIEAIVNNQPLTYVYPTELETCITPNLLLFGRTLSFSNQEPAPLITESSSIKLYSSKISNIINYFWDRWRKEYTISLRKYQKIVQPNDNLPRINIGDVIIVHEKFQPRTLWKMGIIEDVIKGSDGYTRGTVVIISKSNSLIKRPVNLLYPIEYKESLNVEQEVFNEQRNQRPAPREAAIIGELKRKLTED